MNKTELVARVAEATGKTKKETAVVVDAIFEAITQALAAGEEVNVYQFGKFIIKDRPERVGRNPKTGEEITIPASKAPKFKPATALKEMVK